MHKPESDPKYETHKSQRFCNIRIGLVLINKKIMCYLGDFTVSADNKTKVKVKEIKKLDKYQD